MGEVSFEDTIGVQNNSQTDCCSALLEFSVYPYESLDAELVLDGSTIETYSGLYVEQDNVLNKNVTGLNSGSHEWYVRLVNGSQTIESGKMYFEVE